MSAAGQANEAGSVFRRDAAVYFAVHALVGKPVVALDESRLALRLDFETPDPTDDIVVRLSGDVKAFVSAKNHVDAGKSFKNTVAGWVAQLDGGVGPDDLLGLAFESCAGWVHDLAKGLRRLRAGQEVSRPAEIAALKRLDDLVPVAQRAEVRRRARLVQVPGSSVSGDTQTMLQVLMDSVVEGQAGGLAVSALADGIHTLAGAALGADVAALVGMLEAAEGLVVRIGGDSPAMLEAATRAAVREYLDGFVQRRGRVNLPLLADDLAPVLVDGLYESLRVIDSVRSDSRETREQLQRLVRRRRRLLLVGQPGSGKSVATWEIAAACAGDVDAPLPLRVHLPDLLPVIRARDLTLADVIEVGARLGRESSRPMLQAHLTAAAAVGDLMLVLDGLDECRADAPEVAEHLRRVVADLHPDAGVVLATRASAEIPAERLGLPRLDLRRPKDLDATMDAVLVECAKVRVNAEVRAEWLAARRTWVREVSGAQAGLVEVPQLALLVVLIVAESSELDVPRQRAALLHAAVQRSVERWNELGRFKGPELEWARDLTPRMLLDGFLVLGRMLDTVEEKATRADALAGLTAMLTDARWGLAAGRAEELAEQVLKFWDEHVAVFTVDETGFLSSRSRVFTEVATAMWTQTCDAGALEAWAKRAVEYADAEGVFGLAQGLNPPLVQTLLGLGEVDPDASLAVSNVVVNGTIALEAGDLTRLQTQLQRHIEAVDAGETRLCERKSRSVGKLAEILADRRGSTSRSLVEALCQLPLPFDSQQDRREFVANLPHTGPTKLVSEAWVALTDAATENRALGEEDVQLVQAAIDLELPDTPPLIQESRRSFRVPAGRPAPLGLGSVVLLAARHLEQLSGPSAEHMYRLSMRVSMGEHEAIDRALRRPGVDVTPWVEPQPWMDYFAQMADRDYEQQFLGDIAALQAESIELTKVDRWSLRNLGDLIFAAGYATVGIGSFDTAFSRDDRELRTKWLECVAIAYCIDIRAAATQARYLLDQPATDLGRPQDWWTATVRPAVARGDIEAGCLTADQQNCLLEALEASSDWIAWSAANLLVQTSPLWDPDEFFDADRSEWKPYRAMLFHLVAILASANGSDLLNRAANFHDPAYRQAAEYARGIKPSLDPAGEIARKLSRDDDLTVRGDLDTGDPPPIHWSCNDCKTINDIEVADCGGCDRGTRPRRGESVE